MTSGNLKQTLTTITLLSSKICVSLMAITLAQKLRDILNSDLIIQLFEKSYYLSETESKYWKNNLW